MHSNLRDPGELVAHLPYQLGFHPLDSLVVVGLVEGSIEVVVRIDLPGTCVDPAGEDAPGGPCDEFDSTLDRIASVIGGAGVGEAIVLAFAGDGRSLVASVLWLERAAKRLLIGQVDAHHLLTVVHGTWWASRCSCGRCAPTPRPVPGPAQVAAVCDAVVDGVAPLEDRAALTRLVRCRTDSAIERVQRELSCAAALPRRRLAELLGQVLQGRSPVAQLPAADLAALSKSMAEPDILCAVFALVTPALPRPGDDRVDCLRRELTRLLWLVPHPEWSPGSTQAERGTDPEHTEMFAGSQARDVRQRMFQWLACLPREQRPAVLVLIAGSAWSSGAGALAGVAVQEALAIAPGYCLATLLDRALAAGERPGQRRTA